jgi:YfiH family protein
VDGQAGQIVEIARDLQHGVEVVRSELLARQAGVAHAFSTRRGGVSEPPFAGLNLGQSVGDAPAAVAENRRRFYGAFGIRADQAVRVRQVHGRDVLVVDAPLVRRSGFPTCLVDEGVGRDGLVTRLPGLALVVSTADCVPILVHDPVRQAVAAVHAGWRGTAARIAAEALSAMGAAFGTLPGDCLAAVGPSIRACCYEVDAPVAEAMAQAIPGWEGQAEAARPGHWRIDLAGLNRLVLERAGVKPERIEVLQACTACRTDLFFSHRAERGRAGRMMSCIMLTDGAR